MSDETARALAHLTSPTERHRREKLIAERGWRIQPLPHDAELVGLGVYAGSEYFPRPFGTAVASVTGSWICHTGVVFRFVQNGDNYPVVYEARPCGFVGPIAFDDIFKYWNRWCRMFHIRWLPDIQQESLEKKFLCAEKWVAALKGYDFKAILAIWCYVRLGLEPPNLGDDKVICSEAVARLVWPEYDLRTEAYPTFDVLPPGPLWRKLNLILATRCRDENKNAIHA